jgi:hypothetical protein
MMTESAKIVRHMDRLAMHVSRRLQTTDVFQWMTDGNFPEGNDLEVDVREALTKLKKLDFRYNQIWKRRNGILRTGTSGLDPGSVLSMSFGDCCDLERKWVLKMWRKGDWYVTRKDEDGTEWTLRAYDGGKFRWRRISRQSGEDPTTL